MANPMTSGEFIKQLTKWKITYKPYTANWATHNRGNRGNGFGDVKGVMTHHVGDTSQTVQRFLSVGDAKLPGPLCHVATAKNGLLWLIGWGRANHAGLGDSIVLTKVIRENYTGVLKPRTKAQGGQDYDGNGRFYGNEVMYSGVTDSMTSAQYITSVLFAAAICDFHGWKAESAIGHGEWSIEKWDPGTMGKRMDMSKFRDDVRDALKLGPGKWPVVKEEPPVKNPTPTPNQKTYKIQKGDTLWGIAKKFYGDGELWPELVKLNVSKLTKVDPGVTIDLQKK